MSEPIVIGRVGHMEDGQYVTDSVTVHAFDAEGWTGEGTAANEDEAERLAWAHIDERKAESERRIAAAQEAKRLFIEELRNG